MKLSERITRIENASISFTRIAHAKHSCDYSQLNDAEVQAISDEARRDILANPSEWANFCDWIAPQVGERIAAALRIVRLDALTESELDSTLKLVQDEHKRIEANQAR